MNTVVQRWPNEVIINGIYGKSTLYIAYDIMLQLTLYTPTSNNIVSMKSTIMLIKIRMPITVEMKMKSRFRL